LAASPYHCQARVAPTPIEKTIRKRTRRREILLPSDGRISPRAEPAIASSPGRARSGWGVAATSDWCANSRKRPPSLATSPWISPMRSRKGALESCGNFGGVRVTVGSMETPPLSSRLADVSHQPVAGPRPKGAGRAAKQAPIMVTAMQTNLADVAKRPGAARQAAAARDINRPAVTLTADEVRTLERALGSKAQIVGPQRCVRQLNAPLSLS